MRYLFRNDRTGRCRIISINAAKKLLETVDTTVTKEKKITIRYVDHVVEYAQNMEGDIVIINEPGGVHAAQGTIAEAAKKADMEALTLGSEHSKAAGLVILMSPKWKKVKVGHTTLKDKDKRVRACIMEFKAAQPRTPGEPLDRMIITAVYGYNSPNTKKVKMVHIVKQQKSQDGEHDKNTKITKTK